MSDFGFVGAAYEAASWTQDDQQCINWYPEVDPTKTSEDNPATPGTETGRGVMALYPCPGLTTLVTPIANKPVRAVYALPNGNFLAVCGPTLYEITSAYVATSRGTLTSTTGFVSITDNGVSAYIVDGASRYYYTWGTTTFGTLSDGAFTGADICDEIDNYIIYNRPGTNQWGCTDVGDVVSGALNLGTLVGSTCNVVAAVADNRQVLVIGETYSERHSDVGTFPFPFAVIAGSSMQHGCAAVGSIARLGEGFAFLAKDTRGTVTVIQWGAKIPDPKRLSTYAIENAIQSYGDCSDAIGYTYSMAGHEFYVLTFPTQDITWVYDVSTGMWHRRAWRDSQNVYHRHRSNCFTMYGNTAVVGDWENGKIYELDPENYTDAGDPLPCVRRCRHITTDLRRQFHHQLQIQFQPGVGLQTGQGEDPEFILRWSDDGGRTFGNDHFVKIGRVGKYRHRAIKRRLGQARDRVYEVIVTDPVYRVVVSAELLSTPGAN